MLLSYNDVIELLRVSDKVLLRWINEEGLPYKMQDGVYHFDKNYLIEWLNERNFYIPSELSSTKKGSCIILPNLFEAVKNGNVYYNIYGKDKFEVIENAVDLMPLHNQLNRELFKKTLLLRENLGSTALGDGVAIPHSRSPLDTSEDFSLVSIFFLKNAIDFESLDGLPVHTLFILYSSHMRAHLHLLSRIAFALGDPVFKESIKERADREELYFELNRIEEKLSTINS